MKYKNIKIDGLDDPQSRLKANEVCLAQAKGKYTGKSRLIDKPSMFNIFLGKGGTYEGNLNDFSNFNEFIQEKRMGDLGQFFTSPKMADLICQILGIEKNAKVFDPTSGAGVFANSVKEENFQGIEIDIDNVEIAKYLFPKANIIHSNIIDARIEHKFDYILSNPPFNFNWDGVRSQSYILRNAIDWLVPFGFLALIVPEKYLTDEFYYGSDIRFINEYYNHVATFTLPNAFEQYSLKYKTKLLILQKNDIDNNNFKSSTLNIYNPDRVDIEKQIVELKTQRKKHIVKYISYSENSNDFSFKQNRLGADSFQFQLNKHLYEIKTQKGIDAYNEALQLLNAYKNQQKPLHLSSEQWAKTKLTDTKVLGRLKSMYIKKTKRAGNPAHRVKISPYRDVSFDDIVPDNNIIDFLEGFTFNNDKGTFNLNKIQIDDVSKHLMKDASILNWEQGVGKTVGIYAMSKYRNMKTVIIAPTNVIRNMWRSFLELNNEKYVEPKNYCDLKNIEQANYVLVSFSTMQRINSNRYIFKALKKYLKSFNNNYFCVLDEADGMSNHTGNRYKVLMGYFAKAKYKLAATGTLTRNNAAEVFPVLAWLCNGRLINDCKYHYVETDKGLKKEENENCGNRFHPKFGMSEFKRCFSPSKTTVFGIKKQNQDIQNYEVFSDMLKRYSTVRTFKEVCGDKYDIKHILIEPTMDEITLHNDILSQTQQMISTYFNSTGNSRKDNGLKIMRMLKMLMKSCSVPEHFIEYEGGVSTKYLKIQNMCSTNEKYTAIGCTMKETVDLYVKRLSHNTDKEVYEITGSVPIAKRQSIIDDFQRTGGILVCTQQSLASGLNIDFVDNVIIETLQWNIPAISQWYFRFIRYNSENRTKVHYVNYAGSIENNLMLLLLAKERINRSVKFDNNEDIFEDIGIDKSILEMVLEKKADVNGKVSVSWGKQEINS